MPKRVGGPNREVSSLCLCTVRGPSEFISLDHDVVNHKDMYGFVS